MKVRAKHWLNYNGVWHKAGEIFDVDNFDEVREYAVQVGYVSDVFPPDEPEKTPAEAPKKRGGRKKKTE